MAIGVGRDLIEEDVADLVLAGGVDVISREIFAGFHSLGALSPEKCAPFGVPPGLSLGEGSGFVLLESAGSAQVRGITPMARVLGYGLAADAFHETAPDPSGSGVIRAIRAALADAGTTPEEVDFVSAHGTGTEANDAAEWLAVRSTLPGTVPISSAKSFLGHAQGAAGVLELAALLVCMQRGLIPPTLRAYPPRAGAPVDPVAAERPRPHPVRHALKLSAAFGGANTALVIGREAAPRERPPGRAIAITGLGAISPHGLGVPVLEEALSSGRRLEGRVPGFDLARLVRSAPPRDLDPSARFASATASLALADSHTAVRGSLRDRCGIFLGNIRMSPSSVDECASSIEQRGYTRVAAVPFSRMVVNAPAGTCAKLLSLRGPLLTVAAGRASGLLAIVRAAAHLASRRCADLLVAGGLDELPVENERGLAEGAALAVLSVAGPEPAPLRLVGWGVAGPGREDEAIGRAIEGATRIDGVFSTLADPAGALRSAGVDPARLELGLVDLGEFAGGAEASCSAFAFVLACALVRRGGARTLLVLAASESLCCATVVAGPGP
jgi:3-oxoacyl-[acyl-carrier-protein] synthase II